MNARGCLFFSMCVSSSLLVTFCPRGTSTYATTSLIRFTGFFSTDRVRCGGCWRRTRARAERVQSSREGWLVGVYLFERSKNYRSGATSRRCLSFDREATMREFARYLPRETSKPLGSAPLRSVSCEWARRHSVPAWTANALTHFSQATPFLPHLVLFFFSLFSCLLLTLRISFSPLRSYPPASILSSLCISFTSYLVLSSRLSPLVLLLAFHPLATLLPGSYIEYLLQRTEVGSAALVMSY